MILHEPTSLLAMDSQLFLNLFFNMFFVCEMYRYGYRTGD